MNICQIKGFTRRFGSVDGHLPIEVLDTTTEMQLTHPDGAVEIRPNTPCMLTCWQPTPEELELLNKGHPIVLRIIGTGFPPVMLYVGEQPLVQPDASDENAG